MRSRTLALLVLFFGATSLFLLGIVAAPLLGLIPPRSLGGHPAATISLDLSGQVAELQAERADLRDKLAERAAQLASLETQLADIAPAAAATQETEALRERLETAEAGLDHALERLETARKEAAHLKAARDDVQQELTAAQNRIAALQQDVATERQARTDVSGAADGQIEELRGALAERDREIARLQTRAEAAQAAAAAQPGPAAEATSRKSAGAGPASSESAGNAAAPERAAVSPGTPAEDGTVVDGVVAYLAGDYDKAYAIWRPLAEQGDARAQFHLGALYYEGRGVARDSGQARRWLTAAAEGGWLPAETLLAEIGAETR